jgi:hypothetical protein
LAIHPDVNSTITDEHPQVQGLSGSYSSAQSGMSLALHGFFKTRGARAGGFDLSITRSNFGVLSTRIAYPRCHRPGAALKRDQMIVTALQTKRVGDALTSAVFGNLWPAIGIPMAPEIHALREEVAGLRNERHTTRPPPVRPTLSVKSGCT